MDKQITNAPTSESNHNDPTTDVEKANDSRYELLGSTASGKTKPFSVLYSDTYIMDEMSEERYTEHIRQREELIRSNRKNYFPVLTLCKCILTFLLTILGHYLAYLLTTSHISYDLFEYWLFYHPDFLLIYIILYIVFYISLCVKRAIKNQNHLSTLEAYIFAYERSQLSNQVEEDLYQSSIKMSYTYLDQYYKETRQQASRGFFITLGISVIGAIIIIIGVISMFLGVTSAAYVTTASGVIIEFISSIFFHLYNKTIQSMGNYHNKLVLSQNVAIALKVSESIDGPDKNTVKIDMIKALTADINQHINSNKPVE